MTDLTRVDLRVGGQRYEGWTDVRVSRGIERMAGDFEFGATERRAFGAAIRIRPGAECEVLIGGELVITGYVDSVRPRYTSTDHTITIAGRSKTSDIIDSSVINKPRTWKRRRIDQIAKAMLDQYDVELVFNPFDLTEPFRKFRAQPGEKVGAAIGRMAQKRGLLVFDDTEGRLVLERATASSLAGVSLVYGENILEGEGEFDASELYSEYRCKAQRAGSDADKPAQGLHAEATFDDDQLQPERRRVLVIHPKTRSNSRDCADRAQWEANVRAGKSIELTYRVQGWREMGDEGALWEPNTLVRVNDPQMGVDAELLIAEVTFELSNESGQTTSLRLAPREAYVLFTRATRKRRRPTRGIGVWRDLDDVPKGKLRELGPVR
jgi:prophage tail gpP-like protein